VYLCFGSADWIGLDREVVIWRELDGSGLGSVEGIDERRDFENIWAVRVILSLLWYNFLF
jgi:hypothetical protein